MIQSTHLAIDLGAESGRALLGTFNGEVLDIIEIHRFQTGILNLSGGRHWNIYRFYEEILFAIGKARQISKNPLTTIGIDTWGVDYAIVNEDGFISGLPFSYRDNRTINTVEAVSRIVDLRRIYDLTGVQILPFNTLFQLFAAKNGSPNTLAKGSSLLFIPDILNYFLTGIKTTEFTFATTSQLFNPMKMTWENELLALAGIESTDMQQIVQPCTIIGRLNKTSTNQNSFAETLVIAPATHDTASSIAAIPATGSDWAYISTGTWALVGVETKKPIINDLTFRYNITNEGGIEGFRLLKNMMGLWLLQGCRKVWDENKYTYEMLMLMAKEAPQFSYYINPDHTSFFNPPDMPEAIMNYCRVTGQQPPNNKAAMIRGILECLAMKTRVILEQISEATSVQINKIYITGGGINNMLLCKFIADATGLPVIPTFVESTAMGNLLGQLIACSKIKNMDEGRALLRKHMDSLVYFPENNDVWNTAFEKFKEIINKEFSQ